MKASVHPSNLRRAGYGFTLIELMIVLAIAGVLTTMALPSFADALRRTRRSEAIAALLQLQLSQERWRSDHANYATELSQLGLLGATSTGYYTLAIVSSSSDGYVATATAASSQSADQRCRVLKLVQNGGRIVYSSLDASNVEGTTMPNRCWNL